MLVQAHHGSARDRLCVVERILGGNSAVCTRRCAGDSRGGAGLLLLIEGDTEGLKRLEAYSSVLGPLQMESQGRVS